MAEQTRENRRGNVGFGSTYRKGSWQDLGSHQEIGSVMQGQVWMVKPDKKAKAANPCLWMQAGVVKFKNCDNYYDCTTCKYDQAMAVKAERGKQLTWQAAMRRMPDMDRVCRHSLTSRIERRSCAYDYQCATCDFDQFFEDVWTTKSKSMPAEVQQIKGFDVPMDFYFHDGHAWARIEGRRGIAYEQGIQRRYLERLTEAYSRYFHQYNESPLLIVNAATIDPVNNEEHFQMLLQEIDTARSGRQFFNPLVAALA